MLVKKQLGIAQPYNHHRTSDPRPGEPFLTGVISVFYPLTGLLFVCSLFSIVTHNSSTDSPILRGMLETNKFFLNSSVLEMWLCFYFRSKLSYLLFEYLYFPLYVHCEIWILLIQYTNKKKLGTLLEKPGQYPAWVLHHLFPLGSGKIRHAPWLRVKNNLGRNLPIIDIVLLTVCKDYCTIFLSLILF